MAAGTLPIIDVDSHYAETVDGLNRYLDEPWRTRFAATPLSRYIPVALGDRWNDGRIIRPDDVRAIGYGAGTEATDGAEVKRVIVESMKRLGIQATLLVPNRLVTLGHLSTRDLAVAICNAHINYHLAEVADAAQGIYTMPVVTWHEPEAAAKLIDRVAGHPAVVGVCLTTSFANPPWGDVRYDPIYEVAEHHGLPIVYHADAGLTLVEHGAFADGFQRLIEAHSLAFLLSNEVQLTSVIMQGVQVRFPRLKMVFVESGLFWVPMMMYRLDEYFLKRRSEAPLLEALPSEYIRERFWFGTQPIESPKNQNHLAAVFDMVGGAGRFLFASDYPHWDYDDPIVIRRLSFLSDEEKAAVLATNALDVFPFSKGGVQPWHATALEMLPTSARESVSSSS